MGKISSPYSQRAIFIIILGLVASFFMFYRLDKVPPPYPWSDEASAGQDARATLQGALSLYYPDQGGGGSLWVYLTALAFWVVEPGLMTMRWLVGLVGVMTVLCTFGALLELFRTFMPLQRAQGIAFIGALWLAVAAWFVTMSRIAWPPALVPLVVSASFLLLWRGLRTGHAAPFLGAGGLLGLTAYLYLPARFILLVPLAFLGLEAGLSLLLREKPAWWPQRWQLLLMLGVALIVALPMLILFSTNLEALMGRALEVQVQETAPQTTLFSRSLAFHMDALGLTFNLNRSPFEGLILGTLTTIFFLIGLLATLLSLRFPACRYLLVWWLVLLLPSLIAPPLAGAYDPTFLRRAIGALPATFGIVALGLAFIQQQAGRWLKTLSSARFRSLPRAALPLLALVCVALTAWQTLDGFFIRWASSEDATRLFSPANIELVDWLKQKTVPEGVFIFPIRKISRSSTRPWSYTTHFLYEGPASYLPDDEAEVPAALLAAIKAKTTAYLLTESRVQADPKQQFLYLLNRLGQLESQEERLGFDVRQFRLKRWALSPPAQSLGPELPFGNALKLRQADLGLTGDGSQRLLWLELAWEDLAAGADYQVTVRLEDGAGHRVAQQDKLLLNNLYALPTSKWAANTVEKDYYWLEIPPTVLPGEYIVKVGVYDAATKASLPPLTDSFNSDLTFSLGQVRLASPQTVADGVEPVIPVSYPAGHTPLTLLGLEAPIPSEVQLGQPVSLPLLLRLETPLAEPLKLQAELRSADQGWLLASSQELALPADWPAGSPFLVYLDGRVPRDLPGGDYELKVSLAGENEGVTLGQVKVIGREHLYEAPEKGFIPVTEGQGGEVARLLGYALDLQPGGEGGSQASLTLYWQAVAETDISYKVFVHFLDPAGNIVAQIDREPQAGAALTTSWLPGEIIADTIPLPTVEQPANVQTMAVGLYDPQTGQRLPFGENDQNPLTASALNLELHSLPLTGS